MTSYGDAGILKGVGFAGVIRGLAAVAAAALIVIFVVGGAAPLRAATPAAPPPPLPPMGPTGTPAEKADQVEKDRIAGVAAFEHGDYAIATDYFRRVRLIDSSNDEGMFLLGRAFLATGDAAGAVDQFTSAIALNDRVEKYYYARGKAEMKLGKYAAAVADFNRDLELREDKGTPIFFLSRADAYLDNDETALAIKDYDQVIAGDGDLRLAHLHRGVAQARAGDLGAALADLKVAREAGEIGGALDFDTLFYQGVVLQLDRDMTNALADYKAAAVFKDERSPLAQCLADVLAHKRYGLFSSKPKACKDFDAAKALRLPPNS